ncbi:MAG: hypothetical protein OXC08_14700 [Thiotrichales bacterium]|nr:hypothetical protein [Thiotrichales bacterium]
MSCIACLEEIRLNASKCPRCGSYQAHWRNWLPVIGTLAAILTFAGSAAAIVSATATDFWKNLLGEDAIEIIEYTGGRLTVLHSGSGGPLLIEHVTERADALDYSKVSPIHEVVAAGHVFRFPTGTMSDKECGNAVANVPDDEWEKMKRGKMKGVEPYFFSKDALGWKTLVQHMGAGLRTFEARCNVRFRRVEPGSESTSENFPCVGVMMEEP